MDIPLGKNIRRLRIGQGMTQSDLAKSLGVSVQAVSKWERGYSYPDMSLLLPIVKIFDVTLDELFGREDIEKIEKVKKEQRHSNA